MSFRLLVCHSLPRCFALILPRKVPDSPYFATIAPLFAPSRSHQLVALKGSAHGQREAQRKNLFATILTSGWVKLLAIGWLVLSGNLVITKTCHGTTILDIQKAMTTQKIALGPQLGVLELINLNKDVNAWYLIRIRRANGAVAYQFHIENPLPQRQVVTLYDNYKLGLVLKGPDQKLFQCPLLTHGEPAPLLEAVKQAKPYSPICQNRLLVRQTIEGEQSAKEWVVEFLRDEVWGGEQLTTLVKDTLFRDKYLLRAKTGDRSASEDGLQGRGPAAGLIDSLQKGQQLQPENLGLRLEKISPQAAITLGRWYPLSGEDAMFFSVIRPGDIDRKILQQNRDRVGPLDEIEKDALVYLVAFDLGRFDAGFILGTEHPRLEWSTRVPSAYRDYNLPGPDGFVSISPLERTGMISPFVRPAIAATFVGGFKRSHGAFRHDDLAKSRQGHHYGFVENGVIFSQLQPQLATFIIDYDGHIKFHTWQASDTLSSQRVRHARQNGYPLLSDGIPDAHVKLGLQGNWSADFRSVQRTLRAGVCLVEDRQRRYLIYGYFSSVTANAMARVFQAYQCQSAMHLDMNLLEHTYMAHYRPQKDSKLPVAEPLIDGMSAIDARNDGIPRFVAIPDVRDFFYLTYR